MTKAWERPLGLSLQRRRREERKRRRRPKRVCGRMESTALRPRPPPFMGPLITCSLHTGLRCPHYPPSHPVLFPLDMSLSASSGSQKKKVSFPQAITLPPSRTDRKHQALFTLITRANNQSPPSLANCCLVQAASLNRLQGNQEGKR